MTLHECKVSKGKGKSSLNFKHSKCRNKKFWRLNGQTEYSMAHYCKGQTHRHNLLLK